MLAEQLDLRVDSPHDIGSGSGIVRRDVCVNAFKATHRLERPSYLHLFAPRFNRLGDFGCGMCPPRSAVIKPPLNHACKCEFPQNLIVGAVVRLPADDLDHGFLCWAHDGLRWSRETEPENIDNRGREPISRASGGPDCVAAPHNQLPSPVSAGCGGGGPRRVEPRTPTAAELEEAERTSRDVEAAEREAFQQPPARPGATR